MSRVLLTGATGFIGGRTAARLRAAEHEVLCPVRRPSDGLAALGVELLASGLDAVTPETLVDVEVVVHAAATMGPDLQTGTAVNVEGTRRVLASCEQAGVPNLVHVSTAAVYAGRDHGDLQVTEETPLVALDAENVRVYARTKAEAERVLFGAEATAVAILRPPAVLGAGPTSAWGQRIPDRIRAGEPVSLQRGSTFAFVHVDDLVDAIVAAAGLDPDGPVPSAPTGGGIEGGALRVANVVGGHVTVADYVDAVVDLLPTKPSTTPGHDETGWTGTLSTDRLPRLFGVSPHRSFTSGMAEIANALTAVTQEAGS